MKLSFALTAVLALRSFAQSSSVLFDQAVAQLDAGKPAEAFALFSQIARREPNELGTRAYMGNTAAARTNLDLLRRLAASDSGLHAQLAEWCAPGRNVELGVDQVRYALKLEQLAPQKARLYYLRGSLAVRQGAEKRYADPVWESKRTSRNDHKPFPSRPLNLQTRSNGEMKGYATGTPVDVLAEISQPPNIRGNEAAGPINRKHTFFPAKSRPK